MKQARVAGVVALGAGLAFGSLIASIMKVDGPTIASGDRFIDLAPAWLKRVAIDLFGTSDKVVLRAGVLVVLVAAACFIGQLAYRRRTAGVIASMVLAAVGALAALTRTAHEPGDWVPFMVAGPLGALILTMLVRTLDPRVARAESMTTGDRRRFLVGLGAVGGAGTLAVGTGSIIRRRETDRIETTRSETELPKPAATAGLDSVAGTETGASGPWVVPTAEFYRIDTALVLPRVDPATWTLTIGGLVDNPFTLTYDELLAMPMVERHLTISCVSNEVGGDLIGNALWQGVPLAALLDRAGVQPGATQLASFSVDNWSCGFPTEIARDGRDALVAIAMNGEPLPRLHGFPARLVVPGIYGYVSATKWLREIRLTTMEDFEGYWIPRGWSKLGPVKTQSRVDVPRDGATVKAGKVAVAGVAWAIHRGINAVEVKVDDGDWKAARLADQPTVDAWRQWVYEWDATPGRHRIAVRATDGTGELQTAEPAPVDPDGATGHHNITVKVG